MGWAYGVVDGREVGYSVEAVCEAPHCFEHINRGLAYVCGDMHGGGEYGCGGYFCYRHLYVISIKGHSFMLCDICFDASIELDDDKLEEADNAL